MVDGVADGDLRGKFLSRGAEPVITEIRFPRYKAMRPNLTITFTFPITVLVGPNGSNKSSILHALHGAPARRSVAEFWFSTSVDQIESRLSEEDQHRYIYKYRTHSGKVLIEAECRKSRVTRDYRDRGELPSALRGKKNPDAWESTKVSTEVDGMSPIPPPLPYRDAYIVPARDRWKPIAKKVVYIDFRSEISAFDKYLYHSPNNRWAPTRGRRRLSIVTKSDGLARAFSGRSSLRRNELGKVKSTRVMPMEQVRTVSDILGKEFSKIEIINHTFYSAAGYSAKLHLEGMSYSEAHAGSGEFAIVRLVDEISSADPRSLILLDEPEVSLHPGAQRRLIEFIKRSVIQFGHQVVMSTHSPVIVGELPSDAIKLLGPDPETSAVVLLSDDTPAPKAFFHIGHYAGIAERRLIVEDELSAEIVRRAIRVFSPELINSVVPVSFPGGAEGILKQCLPSHALAKAGDVAILLDGDKKTANPEWGKIASTPINSGAVETWKSLAKSSLGLDPNAFPNGSNKAADPCSVAENLAGILSWASDRLRYLHGDVPESALLEEMDAHQSGIGGDAAKEKFVKLAHRWHGKTKYESVTADEILNYQRYEISRLGESSELLASAMQAIRILADSR